MASILGDIPSSRYASPSMLEITCVGIVSATDSLRKAVRSLDFIRVKAVRNFSDIDPEASLIVFLMDYTDIAGLQALARLVKSLESHSATKIGYALAPVYLANEELLFGVELDIRRTFSGVKRDDDFKAYLKHKAVQLHHSGDLSQIESDVKKVIQFGTTKQLHDLRDKLLGLDKTSEDVNRLLALIFEKINDPKKYAFHLKQALAANPQNLWAANKLGMHYLRHHQVADGLAVLRRLSRFHELNGERLFELGQAYLNAGRVDDAEHTLNKGNDLNGGQDPKFQEALAKVDMMKGQLDLALSRTNQKYLSHPILSYLNTRAVLAVKNGQIEQGLNIYNQTLKGCDPEEHLIKSKVLFNQGLAFVRDSKPELAETAFYKSLELGGAKFSRAQGPLEIIRQIVAKRKKPQPSSTSPSKTDSLTPTVNQSPSNSSSMDDIEFESVF